MTDYKKRAKELERILEIDSMDDSCMTDNEWEEYYSWLLWRSRCRRGE